MKFFLNVSKDEQKKRFLDRIEDPEKHWKFQYNDVLERKHWDKYMDAYERAISETATKEAPWFVIPADHKWFMRTAVCDIILNTLQSQNLKYPVLAEEELGKMSEAKALLLKKEK